MTSKNGIIYKICCLNPDVKECYVGSTINFYRRKNHHKQRCNNDKTNGHNAYVYRFIRDNGGFGNWDMVELEKCQFHDKRELYGRERFWFERLEAKLNQQVPSRTNKQRYEDKREDILQKKKQYYKDNHPRVYGKNQIYSKTHREELNKRAKEIITCDCGVEYTRSNKYSHVRSKKHKEFNTAEIY